MLVFVEDEGAAKVGVVETTRLIQSYSHPSYPNLVFYDLPGNARRCLFLHFILRPGVGTLEFKKSTYLAQVNLSRYDFCNDHVCQMFIHVEPVCL